MSTATPVCQTCLTTDRRLVPVQNIQKPLLEMHFSDLLNNCGGVCWECNRMLLKFSTFKSQVTYAQRLLHTSNKSTKFKSLSPLKCETRRTYDLEYTESEDPLTYSGKLVCESLAIIKEETASQQYQNDTHDVDEDSDCQKNSDLDLKIDPNDCKADRTCKKRKRLKKSASSKNSDSDNSYESDTKKKTVKTRRRSSANCNKEEKIDKDLKNLKKKRKSSADCESKSDVDFDEDLKDKYEIVEFTEEEMLKNREEKRNGHNYKKIPYKCDLCVLGFTRKDTYDHHMIRKHDKTIGKHPCPVCTTYFPTPKALQHHKAKHYALYKCRLCKYEASERCFMENHCRAKHRGDRADSIHCQICSAVCRSADEMAAHIRTAHPLRCPQCGEVFKCKKTLAAHMRRIHASKREFTCGTCGRGCASRSRLESHCATHGGAQALRLAYCAPCRVQYKNIYVYRNHRHNSPAHAETAHECMVCHKKFASKVYWKRHIEFFHQKKSKFKCQDCSKTSSTLKSHKLTHSEERRFMCAQCGDTFKQRPSLYTHCKLVHGRAGNTL